MKGDFEEAGRRIEKKVEANKRRSSRFQAEEKRYTLIWHSVRRKLDVSVIEYVVADVIHGLAGNRGPVPGWCYASRSTLAEIVGLSRQGVDKVIVRLAKKHILEVDFETGYLRASDRWVYAVELQKRSVQAANHE